MLPSLAALSNSKKLHPLGIKRVNRDECPSIGTPTNPGQLPWFPNVEDEEDEEDEDYKPDEESMDEEPLEYQPDDERELPPQTPIIYCMSGEAAIVALRADMHNFVRRYNKQVDELSNSPSVVQSATTIVDTYTPNHYLKRPTKDVEITEQIQEWIWRFQDGLDDGSWIEIEFEAPDGDKDAYDEIETMLQELYANTFDYKEIEERWKLLCDVWEMVKAYWNAFLEREKELVHEGRIYTVNFKAATQTVMFGATVEQMIHILVSDMKTDVYITKAAIDAIQQIISNLLVIIDNMNPESNNFVTRLYLTLRSMGITTEKLDSAIMPYRHDEDDSDEIRNKNYLGDPLVHNLVFPFLEFILQNVVTLTDYGRSKVVQLRDVEGAVASILRGHALPVWDRARAKIMAYIRMHRAQIEAAERTYAPGGQGAEEATTSFARHRSLQF